MRMASLHAVREVRRLVSECNEAVRVARQRVQQARTTVARAREQASQVDDVGNSADRVIRDSRKPSDTEQRRDR
jgi:hypothetical protein